MWSHFLPVHDRVVVVWCVYICRCIWWKMNMEGGRFWDEYLANLS